MSPERSRGAVEPELDANAPPWDYDPSPWDQRIPVCPLALARFVISACLALYEWGFLDSVRDPNW